MSWVKVARPRALPEDAARLRDDGKLVLGAACVRALGLKEARSCDIYQDADEPRLVALQFRDDTAGEWAVRWDGGAIFLSLRGLMRRARLRPGCYDLHREDCGLVVIDFRYRR